MTDSSELLLDVFTSIFVKYDGKFASKWRAKSPDALCAVLPKKNAAAGYTISMRNISITCSCVASLGLPG